MLVSNLVLFFLDNVCTVIRMFGSVPENLFATTIWTEVLAAVLNELLRQQTLMRAQNKRYQRVYMST